MYSAAWPHTLLFSIEFLHSVNFFLPTLPYHSSMYLTAEMEPSYKNIAMLDGIFQTKKDETWLNMETITQIGIFAPSLWFLNERTIHKIVLAQCRCKLFIVLKSKSSQLTRNRISTAVFGTNVCPWEENMMFFWQGMRPTINVIITTITVVGKIGRSIITSSASASRKLPSVSVSAGGLALDFALSAAFSFRSLGTFIWNYNIVLVYLVCITKKCSMNMVNLD